MKFLFGAPVIGVIAGVVAGVILQNDIFGATILAVAGLFLVVPTELVVGLVALILFLRERKLNKFLRIFLIVLGSAIPAILICAEIPSWMNQWKVDAVDSYVARALPILDQMKAKDGIYPARLPVDVLGNLPELLRDDGKYSSDGRTFHFEYENVPASWAGGQGPIEFDSTVREWGDGTSP
jgi:hypothetical protein